MLNCLSTLGNASRGNSEQLSRKERSGRNGKPAQEELEIIEVKVWNREAKQRPPFRFGIEPIQHRIEVGIAETQSDLLRRQIDTARVEPTKDLVLCRIPVLWCQLLDNDVSNRAQLKSRSRIAQCQIIQASELVPSVWQFLSELEIEFREILVVLQNIIWYPTELLENLAKLFSFLLPRKSLLDEIVSRHHSLLSIDNEKSVSFLLVEKNLRHGQADDERLDERGGPPDIPDVVPLKTWNLNGS